MEDFFDEYGDVIIIIIFSSVVISVLSYLYLYYVGG